MTKQEMIDLYLACEDFHEVKNQSGLPPYIVHMILSQAGVLKIQDKIQYGSRSQKLAGEAEAYFQQLVPQAIDANCHFKKNNPVYDFVYNDLTIDVKYSSLHSRPVSQYYWRFRVEGEQDVIVAFLEREKGQGMENPYILFIPMSFISEKESLHISQDGLWFKEFQIAPEELENVLQGYAQLLKGE